MKKKLALTALSTGIAGLAYAIFVYLTPALILHHFLLWLLLGLVGVPSFFCALVQFNAWVWRWDA